MKVYKVKINDSSWCVETESNGILEILNNSFIDVGDIGDKLIIEISDMSEEELENLSEFEGF